MSISNARDVAATAIPSAPQVFTVPVGVRLMSLISVILLVTFSIFLAALAAASTTDSGPLALFLAVLTCFMAAVCGYVWRDLRGKWGLRVVLGNAAATLDLPAARSLIHRPPALHRTIFYADIAAVETRLEAYGSLGLKRIERAYVLRCRSGELLFLFEDRAINTELETSFFGGIAAALAARAGVDLHDLGMVERSGGVLGFWAKHTVEWGTPSLPLARQQQLRQRAARTGSLAMGIVVIGALLRLFG